MRTLSGVLYLILHQCVLCSNPAMILGVTQDWRFHGQKCTTIIISGLNFHGSTVTVKFPICLWCVLFRVHMYAQLETITESCESECCVQGYVRTLKWTSSPFRLPSSSLRFRTSLHCSTTASCHATHVTGGEQPQYKYTGWVKTVC